MKTILFITLATLASVLTACGAGTGMKSLSPSLSSPLVLSTTTTTSTTTSTTPDPADGTGGTGGQSGLQQYSCNGRAYILNVPSGLSPSTPVPLVAFFHGLGDDYQNFANTMSAVGWMNSSNTSKYILMIPDHMNDLRASFLHFNGQQFDLAATQAEMTSVMDCILNHAGSRYNISRSRIHWAGFSEGGSFVNLAANYHAQELKTVVPFAGGAQRESPARLIPIYYIVGTADGSYQGIATISNQWSGAGHTVRRSYVNGVGHLFSALSNNVGPGNVWTWMNSQ